MFNILNINPENKETNKGNFTHNRVNIGTMFPYLPICARIVYGGVGSYVEEVGEERTGVVSLNRKNFFFPGKPRSH